MVILETILWNILKNDHLTVQPGVPKAYSIPENAFIVYLITRRCGSGNLEKENSFTENI